MAQSILGHLEVLPPELKGAWRKQSGSTNAPSDETLEALLSEAQRYAAMVSVDLNVLGSLLADDLTYTHANGVTQDKAAYLEFMASGKVTYASLSVEIHTAKRLGETVILTGRLNAEANLGGQTRALANLFTKVLVKQAGKWCLSAWQSTPAPQPA